MATLEVLDWNKKKIGTVDIDSDIVEHEIKKDILHRLVNWQLAKRRQGTHSTKTRGEVSGGGKKPYKQKGTGNARRGSSRSPLLAGGGVTFGPKPRNYEYPLPKKLRQKGLKIALSVLFKEGRLFVVEAMESENGKTQDTLKKLKSFGSEKAVLVCSDANEIFKRSTKNLKNVRYYSAGALNVYDLLKFDFAILEKGAIKLIEKKCGVEN